MVKITCDVCGKAKPGMSKRIAQNGWILGYDLEIENSNALQRSLRFINRWDNARALELGAIHLCSQQCKDEYVSKARAA